MNHTVAVVIPVYKVQMNEFEKISFRRCTEVLNSHFFVLVAPYGLDLSEYEKINPDFIAIYFDKEYFSGIKGYNQLLLSQRFYGALLRFDYILIYQLDAFVFKDELLDWCQKGYDYIGAPWIKASWIDDLEKKMKWKGFVNRVGNGGLSLRKVKSFYRGAFYLKLLSLFWQQFNYNEDFFWSTIAYRLNPFFKIPKVDEALHFAFEDHPAESFETTNQKLPFGCHAWEKYDLNFWKKIFKELGYEI